MSARTANFSPPQIGLNAAAVLLCLLAMTPFAFMVVSSAKDPAQFYANLWALPSPIRWENYGFAFGAVLPYIINSILVSASAILLTALCGLLAAYSFVFLDLPFKRAFFWAVLVLLMLPGILVLVPLFLVTRQMGLMNTYAGIILPQVAGNLVIAIFLFHSFLEDFPRSLIEAARMEGAGELRVLGHIVLPLSKPIASTVAIITLLSTWNNYIWPLIVVRDELLRPIPLGLAFIMTEHDLQHNPSLLMACYAIASIPLLVCFLVFLRPFLEGLSSGALKE